MSLLDHPLRIAAAIATAIASTASAAWYAAPAHDRPGDAAAPAHDAARTSVRVAFAGALPPLDGGRLRLSAVEVRYGPGESSPPHSHPCPVVAYVAAGAVRTRTRGGVEAVYRAGEAFYEAPNGVHLVSANASATEPATLLATFVCDGDAPLTSPVPTNSTTQGTPR